jgi:hypothetical protein
MPRGFPGKGETNGGILFATGMPGLKLLADNGGNPLLRPAK